MHWWSRSRSRSHCQRLPVITGFWHSVHTRLHSYESYIGTNFGDHLVLREMLSVLMPLPSIIPKLCYCNHRFIAFHIRFEAETHFKTEVRGMSRTSFERLSFCLSFGVIVIFTSTPICWLRQRELNSGQNWGPTHRSRHWYLLGERLNINIKYWPIFLVCHH